jgi:predicted ferric reductase
VVFVAGGVGVNPLMSMVSWIADVRREREGEKKGGSERGQEREEIPEVKFLYTTKTPSGGRMDEILFYERIKETMSELNMRENFQLFLTPPNSFSPLSPASTKDREVDSQNQEGVTINKRRITHADLLSALGPVEERAGVVCYICGVPRMTDEFVKVVKEAEGMEEGNVLCERWW